MRSEPLIIVTCDGEGGCDARIEVFGEDEASISAAIEAEGWKVSGREDFCDECAEFKSQTA